jgi:hypothetical protein
LLSERQEPSQVEGSEGADPAAEEAAEEKRGHDDDEAPEEPAVEGAAAEGVDQGGERVRVEKEADRERQAGTGPRGVPGAAELGLEKQEQKQRREGDLRDAAEADDFHLAVRSIHTSPVVSKTGKTSLSREAASPVSSGLRGLVRL